MDKLIEKIIAKHKLVDVENGLVQLFLEENHITVKNNSLIKKINKIENPEIESIKNLFKKHIDVTNIDIFINVCELLVPEKDKKINGAFFTPQIITEFITSNTIKSASDRICDPSCGCGAFLITAAIFISNKYDKNIVDVIEQNIYGVDISEYSVRRAKIILTLLALKKGFDVPEIKFNIITADSLKINWREAFPKIKSGFEVVLGNPPYVKFQDMQITQRNNLNKYWETLKSGNYNLYFAFFELGLKLMNKETGLLGYITPNNYFTSLSAKPLREFFISNKILHKIIDFNHLKLFKAQTYTCVTFLKKNNTKQFYYERINDYESLNNLNVLKYSKINFNDLDNKKWRLLKKIDQENIRKIENAGKKLGELVDIRVGIATCKDSLYFIDGRTLMNGYYEKIYNGVSYKIEKEITQPIAKISDFKNQTDLKENYRRIIFPYKRINKRVQILTEDELKDKFPQSFKYLLAVKNELLSRDKGGVEYPAWYSYARSQGLNFFGEKLLTPTFSSEPRFLLEQNEEVLFCNGYAIFLDKKPNLFDYAIEKLNLITLAKILNSKVMDYYIKKTSVSIEGGYPCYQKNFIELLGIPNFTHDEIRYLEREQDSDRIDRFLINKYAINI